MLIVLPGDQIILEDYLSDDEALYPSGASYPGPNRNDMWIFGRQFRLPLDPTAIRTIGLRQITRSTEGYAEHKSEQSHYLAYSSSLRKKRKGDADGGDQRMTK